MSFQEKDLEELIVGLLSDIEGFEYVHGDNLERALDNVLLEADLRNFLAEKYKNDPTRIALLNHTAKELSLLDA